MNIVTYPHAILNEDLTTLNTSVSEVRPIIEKFIKLCERRNGIGLAANQANLKLNMCVVGHRPPVVGGKRAQTTYLTLINPVIVKATGKPKKGLEGCLSVPGRRFYVKRVPKVKVEYMNLNGERLNRTFKGDDARCFLHEYDHLKGLTLVETGEEF